MPPPANKRIKQFHIVSEGMGRFNTPIILAVLEDGTLYVGIGDQTKPDATPIEWLEINPPVP